MIRFLVGLLIGMCLTVPPTLAATPIVVIVSMDGLRHDYPDLPGLQGMRRMQQQGSRVQRLIPVYPSNTFPGHVSLATGAQPNVHGIVDNFFADRERGVYFMSADTSWLQAEPLWIAAERQGVRAATYFWVGSEADWQDQGVSYRMAPFDGERPEAVKVDQMLEWLSLPEAQRPGLIMSYWAGTDRVAHRYGPDSSRTYAQLREQDAQLVRLQEGIDALGLWPRLTLMLVSDHGMVPMGRFVNLEQKLATAGIVATVTGYTVAHVYLEDAAQLEKSQEILSQVRGVQVIGTETAKAKYHFMHPTRSGDLIVLAEPPVIFSRPPGFEGWVMSALSFFGWDFGGHGYDPQLPDMGAVWMLQGRGVQAATKLPTARQVDVAATAVALLGIEPPKQSIGVDQLSTRD